MTTEHDIKKTALIISKYLPKWNHSNANFDSQKEAFIQAVNQLDFKETDDIAWEKFGILIEKYVPDNHIQLKRNNKNLIPHKTPLLKTNVTKDLPLNCEKFHISDKGEWYLSTKKIGSQAIGVITIPFLSYAMNESEEARDQFVKRFFELKKENNWTHLIFDFRGNTGGDAQVIKDIAERLAGHSLKYADKTETILPSNTDPYHHLFKNKEQEAELHTIITDDISDRSKGNIYILQDGWNASASEGAIFMLKQLNNSYSIGEKTSGTYQSGALISLNIAPETELAIGTRYSERLNKKGMLIEEKVGMKPDIATPSENALKKALSHIKFKDMLLLQNFSILSSLSSLFANRKPKKNIIKGNNQR